MKGKGTDETLSELAEQMSFDVNGKDNGRSLKSCVRGIRTYIKLACSHNLI